MKIGFNSQTTLSILTTSSNSARFCSLCRLFLEVNLTIWRTSTSVDRLYNFSQLTLVRLLDRIWTKLFKLCNWMDYDGYALCSVESSWTGQSTYHTYIFLVKPFKLVWLCEPLPPITVDFTMCAVLLRFNWFNNLR